MTEKELFEKLRYQPKNAYEEMSQEQIQEMLSMCDEYRTFLDCGKTERECVSEAERMAVENGFLPLEKASSLRAGDKVYLVNRHKNILLAVIGSDGLENGANIVGAHIDSPRLDLKQNPLYESTGMALLKTHYYGGIKKYQWTAIPLALHGVVYTKDGKQEICIGEKDTDPVFCVTDLLPHLAKDQMNKKMIDGIEGESLNILIGGLGVPAEDVPEKVKFKILSVLNTLYGIREKDFLSAELEAVPAFKARNVGLDESMIGAYGQDDRVCAFTALKSILAIKEIPKRTAVCLLVDKEEIGSVGNTGMLSRFFEMTLAEMLEKESGSCTVTAQNRMIRNSVFLSSDVGAAVDPNYESVSEKNNSAFAGHGMILMKYTGSRGKSGASDASAEFVHEIAEIMDSEGVVWQTGELGKVDQGGGGTVAMYVANLNMDVIDCGVPVLSMHSPFEVTAKTDVYMAYRAYEAFYRKR